MITVDKLAFSYGKHTVLEEISFEVEAGECLVLAGPNGSGKSTSLALIAGALKASSGTVTAQGRIGYIPQGTALLEDATVLENLKFFSRLAHSALPKSLPFSVEKYLDRKVARLSGGMKKQVSIACALIGDPQIILLDEPCAALDIAFCDEMIDIIEEWKKQGKAILYVGHDPAEFYRIYNKIVFLDKPVRSYTKTEVEELSGVEKADFVEFYKQTLLSIERR